MSQSPGFVAKRRSDSEFSKLRALMLKNVQEMSGHQWTDYNLHDPGITILEQLCYALTDINYRSEYPVEDLLVNEQGTIDLHRHGLFTPDETLPNRPLSLLDYQKYFVDKVDEIAYVFLKPAKFSSSDNQSLLCNCIFDVFVKLKRPLTGYTTDDDRKNLKLKILRAFSKARNLAEDINQIIFIKDETIDLIATVEIEDNTSSMEILAEIYFRLDRTLSGALERKFLQVENDDEQSLSDKMTGPLVNSGLLDDRAIKDQSKNLSLSSLVSVIKKITGIYKIKSIVLQRENGDIISDFMPSIQQQSYRLGIPENQQDIQVQLINNGKNVETSISDFKYTYEMLVHNRFHQQQAMQFKAESSIYQHQKKTLTSYTSVQSQFPNVYGINQYGIPPGFSIRRKAQAMQLKGYMLMYDQVMVDHLATLDNIKDLFSLNINSNSSYKTQKIEKECIADIESLYLESPDSDYLTDNGHYENFIERKLRVLDYLLALNGKDKQQYAVEYKNPYFSDRQQSKKLLSSKVLSLASIHKIMANRNAAYNYNDDCWESQNVSTLQFYICNLLGLEGQCRSLIKPLTTQEHDDQFSFLSDKSFFIEIDKHEIEKQAVNFVSVPCSEDEQQGSSAQVVKFLKSRFIEVEGLLGSPALVKGVIPELYRVGQVKDETSYELFLNYADENNQPDDWKYIASYKTSDDAFLAAHEIRHGFVDLNLQMEGLHLIEHSLLLALDDSRHKQVDEQTDQEFYAFQISILLPDWTTRFRDVDFQQYVEKLIRDECPAHIYCNIHWVDFSTMQQFERLFENWLYCKKENTAFEKLNRLSADLTEFLQKLLSDRIELIRD